MLVPGSIGADLMQRPPWAACAYCHGEEGRIDSAAVPALAAQSASYIAKQLADFRSGRRHSPDGQMRSATMLLDAADDSVVAEYFATLEPSRSARLTRGSDGDTGARLYWQGNDGQAACVTCHAATRDALGEGYPFLFGLHRDYLARQLRAFRDASRGNDRDGVMRTQAATLSDHQVMALATYLASARPR